MQTTTVIAKDSRAALDRVMDALGPDAVIIETRKTAHGVEVTAGIEAPVRRKPAMRAPAPAVMPRHDPMVRFIEQAKIVGIDPEVMKPEFAIAGEDLADLWSRFMVRIERDVAIAPPAHRDLSHICVVGDSGSAKTTTLAQMAAMAHRENPDEPMALLAGDRRLGAREQLRVIARMLELPFLEPNAKESLADAVVRLGGNRRLFIDMPSDPRMAACEVDELRARFGRVGTLSIFCTLPLTGQIARHRQVAQLFDSSFDGYVVTHAGETLPPGAVLTMLIESGLPLAYIGRSPEFANGLDTAWNTSLCRMVVAVLTNGGSATIQ